MKGHWAVIAALRDGTAGNLVGGSGTTARVFPGDPQQGQTYPCISVETYDDEPFDTKSGAATTDNELVKALVYADTDYEAGTIAAAMRTDLDERRGTINGLNIENIRFLRSDNYDLHLTNRRVRVHEHDYEVRITF